MLLLRFIFLGILGAVILSGISMLSLNQISELGAKEYRLNFMLSLAATVETHPIEKNSLDFVTKLGPPPFGRPPRPPRLGARPPRIRLDGPRRFPPGGPPRPALWVVNADGQIVSSTTPRLLPMEWQQLEKPKKTHELSSQEDWLKLRPGIFIVKLATNQDYFLVLQEERRHLTGPFFITQLILVFVTVCVALILALSITFFYLQKKSKEAKAVLLRLEKGDLKARFQIKSFDESGNLLLHFNRMAEQIEKLVIHVQETEKTRRNLLQELGHDLRTPLTGLNTSFETLKFHWPKMTDEQRAEMFGIMGGEIEYLTDLLDKLMTIANLDEPHYRADSDVLDLVALLSQEVSARDSSRAANSNPGWLFSNRLTSDKPILVGDPHLILRMTRNALDNAAKFADAKVLVSLAENESSVFICIEDDGPGFSPEALRTFGHRLEHRVRRQHQDKNNENSFSLGLGSVIMKSIAELHQGSVAVSNHSSLADGGARIEIVLPKSLQS